MTVPEFIQKFFRIPAAILECAFFFVSAKGKENFNGVKPPFIIIANHTSRLDPHMIWRALPIWNIFKYPAVRFMAYKPYMDIPVAGFLMSVMGAYPIERYTDKPMEELLAPTLEILKKGEVLIMFPEGKIKKSSQDDYKARPGIAYIAKNSNVPIVPAAISRKKLVFCFYQYKVIFGHPFYYNDSAERGEDLKIAADKRMDRVRALPLSLSY